MKNLAMFTAFLVTGLGMNCASGQNKPADDAVVEVIRKYIQAGDRQDVGLYNEVTHPDFRVIAGDYPNPGKATIMSREVFGGLLSGKKIGGDPRRMEVKSSRSSGTSTAEVAVTMTGSKLKFDNLFTVVLTAHGWKVLQDRAVVSPVDSGE